MIHNNQPPKLPPPPCAVLLVHTYESLYIYIYISLSLSLLYIHIHIFFFIYAFIYLFVLVIYLYTPPKKKNRSFGRPNAYSGRLLGDDQERHPKHTFEPYFHDPFLQFPHHRLHKCKGNTRPELQHVATSIRSSSLEDSLTVFASESCTAFCIC